MSETNNQNMNDETNIPTKTPLLLPPATPTSQDISIIPPMSKSNATTPTSSITGVPPSRLKAPITFSGSSSVSKICRPCSHAAPKGGPPPRGTSSMSRESDDNLSSINSQYTDHGSILTHDTEQFIIGQRVWVGGIRPGQIAYIGETHFAPGEWAGVVLDDPSGKNDGCVAGKRYFQCEPKRGIFSRLTRLTLAPLPGAQTPSSPVAKYSPDRSRTVSPTASIRSSFLRNQGKNGLAVGDRVIVSSGFGSRPGVLRYLGETQFASGNWCGIELDEASGKNDGAVDGVRYFECKPKHGVFVPIAKVSLSPSSKKSRLSRTGSRESLTSIGTMNSIATTNTSRLRLNAQRKSSPLKPVAVITSKNQFSMQDVLREKQQHIEQLMIERELDREDSQNTALQFQKNINELKTYIALLERQLTEERKKAEDLQFSIDEATFCGDELNAQTQVYKEKIYELESKIRDLTSGKITSKESLTAGAESDDLKTNELAKATTELTIKNAECVTLDELVKEEELVKEDEKTEVKLRTQEISELKEEIIRLTKSKCILEADLKKYKEEVLKLYELQSSIERKLKEAVNQDIEKSKSLMDLEKILQELRLEFGETQTKNQELRETVANLRNDLEKEKSARESAMKSVSEKEFLLVERNEDLYIANETTEKLKRELEKTLKNRQQVINDKTNEAQLLKEKLEKLQEKSRTLEEESSFAVQQMSTKISEIECKNKRLEQNLKITTDTMGNQRQNAIRQDSVISSKVSELQSTVIALETTSKLLEKLKGEHEVSVVRRQEVEDELKKTKEENVQHQLDLRDLCCKLESCNSKCENLVAQNEILQQEIIAARTSNATIQNDVRKLNEEIQNKQNEITNLISIHDAKHIEMTGQLEEVQQKLTSSIKDFNELKDVARKSKEEIKHKIQNITELEEKTIKQELLLSDNQRHRENLQTKYEDLVRQNESLQKDLISLRSSSTDSNAELIKLSQEIANNQKAFDRLTDKTNEERGNLEGQLEASQQRIDGMCNQVETLTNELKNVTEESFNRLQLLKQEQEKCGKQDLNMAGLHRKLESFTVKCDNLEEQNKTFQNDLILLRQGLAVSNAEIVKLTEELTKKDKILQRFTNKANDDRLTLESQLQDLKQSLKSKQSEVESLYNTLRAVEDAKKEQMVNFEICKRELESKAQAELKELQDTEKAKQETIIANFEDQIRNYEQSKTSLDEGISSLQKQIQLLQDELFKSQVDFKTKETDMKKDIKAYKHENEQLHKNAKNFREEVLRLLHDTEKLKQELTERESALVKVHTEAEQQRIIQLNSTSDLEVQLKKLQNDHELRNADCEYKSKLIEEYEKKIDELKTMLEYLKVSNKQISATNEELAEALRILEQEKCETANIFELFEMESDENIKKLVEKISSLKQELVTTQEQLHTKDNQIEERRQQFKSTDSVLQSTQQCLNEAQNTILELKTQLAQLQQANEELQSLESEGNRKQREEMQIQLKEYNKIINEVDETSSEKSNQLEKLQTQIVQLQQEKSKSIENEQSFKIEFTTLQRKLELVEVEKTMEIVALKQRINHLQFKSNLKQNGDNSAVEILSTDDSTAQVNFLNSIIADMQKKNDTLKTKIEALEALPTDFTKPAAFELIAKRKPAPRLFCDICDEFDIHETEDCPLQASDDQDYSPPLKDERNNNDPANRKERKIPEPRKYCESCEVFGHESGECDDECY